jgi:hypothetical protein
MALPVRTFATDPGVIIAAVPAGLVKSGFAGISTWKLTADFDGVSEGTSEFTSDEGHGGAGGLGGGSVVPGETSEAGASGISSIFGSVGFGVVASASPMSTSAGGGGGVVSFAGVGSRGVTSTMGPEDKSIAEGSSSGGEGGSGEGLFEVTSFKIGDLRSVLTDVDRMRSR